MVPFLLRPHLLHSDLQRSHYIVEGNYNDLIQSIEAYEDGSIELSEDTYEEVEKLALEFSRHLQNYVAATKGRYDLTQHVIEELAAIDSEDPSIREYYEEQKMALNIVEYGSFFTGLRNYCLHDRPPIVKISQETNHTHTAEGITTSVERQLKLRKSDLLERGDYLSGTAKDFLNERDEELHVRPIIESYNCQLDELYDGLDAEIQNRFTDSFEETRELYELVFEKQREVLGD